MAHTCHAFNCETSTPPKMFMCAQHWRMVPKPMQDAIWASYTPGQERHRNIKPEYFEATRAARVYVRDLEAA